MRVTEKQLLAMFLVLEASTSISDNADGSSVLRISRAQRQEIAEAIINQQSDTMFDVEDEG